MSLSKTYLLLLSLLPCAAACGGPSVGELAEQQVTLTLDAVTSDSDAVALGDAKKGLGITRAFVSASALSLLPCSDNVSEIALPARGYDLLEEPAPSELVSTAVTSWCGIRLDVDPVTQAATDGIPDGTSLYVEGADADGNAFTLSSNSSLSLSLRADADEPFGAQTLLLGFDLAVWLAGLPAPTNGADESATLLDAQLRDSAALYLDRNGNGALDEDEQTPVARAAPSR